MGSIFRQHLPLLTALVVGLAVALVSAKYLYTYVNTNKEMTRVPVPAYNIPPYTVITPQDITWKEVVKGAEEPGTISDPSEAAGKISLSTLYQGEQIRRERLADAGLLLNRQVLSINVDVTRCVGGALKMGDLVNVWWVIDPSQPTGWQLAAADAVVLDIRDSAGRSLLAQQGPVQSLSATFSQVQSSAPPAVVIMAVYPQDVSRIVGGASPKSQNAVLVKKYAQGREEVSDVAVKQNEQTAKQQQTQQSHGG
ncbi:MAG: SAF domain-containing protein [Firmicutes bacterium]|nr:SAF domain-containing protein [Bacillota bacterium]